jgi:hypothetical protein
MAAYLLDLNEWGLCILSCNDFGGLLYHIYSLYTYIGKYHLIPDLETHPFPTTFKIHTDCPFTSRFFGDDISHAALYTS